MLVDCGRFGWILMHFDRFGWMVMDFGGLCLLWACELVSLFVCINVTLCVSLLECLLVHVFVTGSMCMLPCFRGRG